MKDINQNRHRVQTILKRLEEALQEDVLDSSRIVDVIKGTKVGQGLKFLPRKLNDPLNSLQICLEDLSGRFVWKICLEDLSRRFV